MSGNSSNSDSFHHLTGINSRLRPSTLVDDDNFRAIKIALQLQARDLPNLDTHGRSDPFVVVYRKIKSAEPSSSSSASTSEDKWERLGSTETVYNNLNPKWASIFIIEYRFGTNSILRFAIYDRDCAEDDITRHDYIGDVQCTVAQIVLADNQRLECPVRNYELAASGTNVGTLIIRAEEQKGDLGETVTFQFAASSLRRARRPFYVLYRKNQNDADFAPVVYSEVHQRYSRNQTTTFRPVTKSIARLVNNDQDRELMLEFYDYDRHGEHYRGGSVTFTLKSVRQKMSSPGGTATFTLRKLRSRGQIIDAGVVTVKKCDFSIPYSFVDYLHSGVVINVVVAVDMSNTNGDPQVPNSLHYNNRRIPNEYVVALREAGNVLAAYTTKETFRTYGFGAVLPNEFETSHCFALTGNTMEPVCYGIPGLIETYYRALNTVAPYEPCLYGPVLEHVIRTVREDNERDYRSSYTILLLVTDGDFADFEDVANLICGAADLPLSIVIVGVGNSDFVQLERLDGDEERLCSSDGTPCARDIVQFVQFHKHRYNPTQLSREVLDEIPDQLVSYMRSRSIRPDDIKAAQPASQISPRRGPYYPEATMRPARRNSSVSLTNASGSPPPSISLPLQNVAPGSSGLSADSAASAPLSNAVPTPVLTMTTARPVHSTASMTPNPTLRVDNLATMNLMNAPNVQNVNPMSPMNSIGYPAMYAPPIHGSFVAPQHQQLQHPSMLHSTASFLPHRFSTPVISQSFQHYPSLPQMGQHNPFHTPPHSSSGPTWHWGGPRPREEVE